MKKIPINKVKEIFSKKNVLSSYLLVEKEMALAQSELKIIPKKLAIEISKKCNIKYLNLKLYEKDLKKTKAPIVSLVNSIVKLCSEESKKYVHYGATTQNITQAGLALLMRKSHIQAMYRLSDCLKTLSKLSFKFSNQPMIARTNGQHGMPMTFGFKISEWTEEILRFEERFEEIEKRLFILVFGGAVGAMHSFKNKGEPLYKNLANRLNLKRVEVPSRVIIDNIAEYTFLCSHLAAALSNIGRELNFYMRDEIQEISENLPKGTVGSSTMPQKINPKYVYTFVALAEDLASYTSRGNAMMSIQNEGDLAMNQFQKQTIQEIFPKLNILLEEFNNLLNVIRINRKKMNENLEITKGLINSENIVMSIAPILGKQKAYKILHEIVDEVRLKNKNYQEALNSNNDIKKILSRKKIIELTDSKKNIGNSKNVSLKMSKIAEHRSSKLCSRLSKINQVTK